MQSSSIPVAKDLVLVGGGHAHVAVLKRFGMEPMPGVRLTLITRDIHTPYSGMLPGYIAGHYVFDDCHIDLGPLARFAGARLIHGEVDRLDADHNMVYVGDRPPIRYDALSINIGSRPQMIDVKGAQEHALPVKPIDRWLEAWGHLQQKVLEHEGEFRVVVVGGGAGGVELALSTQYRLTQLLEDKRSSPRRVHFTLITAANDILDTHNAGVRRRFRKVLAQRGVTLHTAQSVIEVSDSQVTVDNGKSYDAAAVLWVTNAAAAAWPGQAGLATDDKGFIRLNRYLQSVSHPNVFAAGDIAAMVEPRPKSGVFAVRQGPILTENLRRQLVARPLKAYQPQRNFLGLISTGDKYAVASRGIWSWQGAWLWTLKDWIDRRFMQRFNELPEMPQAETKELEGLADHRVIEVLSSAATRCGGCGAKVGSDTLSRVIKDLPAQRALGVEFGLDAPDDAVVLRVPEDKVLVQSVDYFRAFIDDPYVFGQIATNHALGDLFAMGAEPHSVLAIATVPFAAEAVVESTLANLLAGTIEMLSHSGGVLAGGHSGEGSELAYGLAANGIVDPNSVLRKVGLKSGDALILTKPIGTGTLLAADMRRRAKGRWIQNAIDHMLVSNKAAAQCLRDFGVTACTDVTGFGLVGHLVEMLTASNVAAQLQPDAVPILEGAADTVASGIVSSLQPQNIRLRRAIGDVERAAQHPLYPLLFDPQTAGGLLAGVSYDRAMQCVETLQQQGYPDSRIIGRVTPLTPESARIEII